MLNLCIPKHRQHDMWIVDIMQAAKTLAEQKAAVLASAALKKAQRREARQREEAENLEILRRAREAESALDATARASQVIIRDTSIYKQMI